MERLRPGLDRQKSMDSPGGTGTPTTMSPLNRHARSSSSGLANMKRPQNLQAKAAAQRLAQVMAHQSNDDEDEDEDDLPLEPSTAGLGLGVGRSSAAAAPRPRTPMSVRAPAETPQPVARTPVLGSRPSLSVRTSEKPSLSSRVTPPGHSSQSDSGGNNHRTVEQPPSIHSVSAANNRSPLSTNSSVELTPSVKSPLSVNTSSFEQPPSARSASAVRPYTGPKTVPMVPPAVNISLKQQTPRSPAAPAFGEGRRDKRLSLDMGLSMNLREPKEPPAEITSTALQDEVDMLQEENDNLLEKLRLAEERYEEAEARAKQLEKQVANLGEGVTLEARLLSRKEAALQQREAALRVATQRHIGSSGSNAVRRVDAEAAQNVGISALEQIHEYESELKVLRSVLQRLMLTKDEMEEVVLKRCWLARYWGLCVKYGIYSDIAGVKHEYWSSFAPLPNEVVLAAGQKAKDDSQPVNDDMEEREQVLRDVSEVSGERNAESMLLVDKGLREMSSLKVEDAVLVAMALHRRRNLAKSAGADDLRSPVEGQKFSDAYELNQEEGEDVQFKLAWLMYFWRRAKNHELELDIADERLQLYISISNRSPTSHDAVDVERGIMEIRKLGLETRLWVESRRWLDSDSHSKMESDTDF